MHFLLSSFILFCSKADQLLFEGPIACIVGPGIAGPGIAGPGIAAPGIAGPGKMIHWWRGPVIGGEALSLVARPCAGAVQLPG